MKNIVYLQSVTSSLVKGGGLKATSTVFKYFKKYSITNDKSHITNKRNYYTNKDRINNMYRRTACFEKNVKNDR